MYNNKCHVNNIYQKEHSLLQTPSRMLQQASLANELPVGLYQTIESAHVTLELAQQIKVLDGRQRFAHLVRGPAEHD